MCLEKKVTNAIQDFLDMRCGKSSEAVLVDQAPYCCGKPCIAQNKMPLLQIACMGNAEKTIQCELFYFLRTRGINCLMEVGVGPMIWRMFGHRSVDIMVMNGDNVPKIAIELKHYSSNQGSTKVLLKNMEQDQIKEITELSTIQIGFYTTVNRITKIESEHESNLDDFKFLRFISTYVLRKEIKPSGNSIFARGKIDNEKNTQSEDAILSTIKGGGAPQTFQYKHYRIEGNIKYFYIS